MCIAGICRMWKIYFLFMCILQNVYCMYMQYVENLLSIQVYAECGKSTFDSSICIFAFWREKIVRPLF